MGLQSVVWMYLPVLDMYIKLKYSDPGKSDLLGGWIYCPSVYQAVLLYNKLQQTKQVFTNCDMYVL